MVPLSTPGYAYACRVSFFKRAWKVDCNWFTFAKKLSFSDVFFLRKCDDVVSASFPTCCCELSRPTICFRHWNHSDAEKAVLFGRSPHTSLLLRHRHPQWRHRRTTCTSPFDFRRTVTLLSSWSLATVAYIASPSLAPPTGTRLFFPPWSPSPSDSSNTVAYKLSSPSSSVGERGGAKFQFRRLAGSLFFRDPSLVTWSSWRITNGRLARDTAGPLAGNRTVGTLARDRPAVVWSRCVTVATVSRGASLISWSPECVTEVTVLRVRADASLALGSLWYLTRKSSDASVDVFLTWPSSLLLFGQKQCRPQSGDDFSFNRPSGSLQVCFTPSGSLQVSASMGDNFVEVSLWTLTRGFCFSGYSLFCPPLKACLSLTVSLSDYKCFTQEAKPMIFKKMWCPHARRPNCELETSFDCFFFQYTIKCDFVDFDEERKPMKWSKPPFQYQLTFNRYLLLKLTRIQTRRYASQNVFMTFIPRFFLPYNVKMWSKNCHHPLKLHSSLTCTSKPPVPEQSAISRSQAGRHTTICCHLFVVCLRMTRRCLHWRLWFNAASRLKAVFFRS